MGLLDTDDLIASYYTLNGAQLFKPARFTFSERAAAAAAAGITALGMTPEDLDPEVDQAEIADLRAVADEHGISVPELEFLAFWYAEGQEYEQSLAFEQRLYALADAFGSRQANAGMILPPGQLPPMSFLAERFAALCDRAADHGLIVALEPMPIGCLETPQQALEIVTSARRPNGGILLDAYHFHRGPADREKLRETIPPELVVGIQLNDADAELTGSLDEECIHHRRLPGEGGLDLVGWLLLLDSMGVRAPLGVEMMSDELRALPVVEAATRVASTTRSVISTARAEAAQRG